MNALRSIAAASLLTLFAHGALAGEYGSKTELDNLSGTYASAAPEPWYGGFGTRSFSFADGEWGLSFEHALDPGMGLKTFRFRTEGPYEVGVESAVVAGAYDAVFHEDRKFVTLLTEDPAIVEAFGFADCGLEFGVEVDISESGCASWRPVAVCGADHDLLAIDEVGLYFGVRPSDNDMCTPDKRPTALLPAVVLQ